MRPFLLGLLTCSLAPIMGCGGKSDKGEPSSSPDLVVVDRDKDPDRKPIDPKKDDAADIKTKDTGPDGKGKDSTVATRPDTLPAFKVAKEKEDTLRALCKTLARKDPDALDRLEKAHPDLFKHVVPLIADSTSDELMRACTAIGEMGTKAKGVTPLMIEVLDRAIRAFEKREPTWLTSAVTALALVCPDDPEARDAQKRAVAAVLLALARPEGEDDESKWSYQRSKLDMLASLASHAPMARPEIVKAVTPHLATPELREGAARVLGACGSHAEPARAALRRLRLERGREAVEAALKEIDVCVRVAGQLAKVGLFEENVPTTLFRQAREVMEGQPAFGLQRAPRDAYTFVTLQALARQVGAPDARKAAVMILGGWGRDDRTLRSTVAPELARIADDAVLGEVTRRWLAICGPDGVKALQELKSPALGKMEPLLIAIADPYRAPPDTTFETKDLDLPFEWPTIEARMDAVMSLGTLRATSQEMFSLLGRIRTKQQVPAHEKEYLPLVRILPLAMEHFGPSEARYLDSLVQSRDWYGKAGDAEMQARYARIVENILAGKKGEPESINRNAVLVLLDPKASPDQKRSVVELVYTGTERNKRIHAFAKEIIRAEERQAFLEVFAEHYLSKETLRLAVEAFGEEAGPAMARPFIRQVEEWYLSKESNLGRGSPLYSLGLIGARAGPEARKVVERYIESIEKRTDLGSYKKNYLKRGHDTLVAMNRPKEVYLNVEAPNEITKQARLFLHPLAQQSHKEQAYGKVFDWFLNSRSRSKDKEEFLAMEAKERQDFMKALWTWAMEQRKSADHLVFFAEHLTNMTGKEAVFVEPYLNKKLQGYFLGGDLEVRGSGTDKALRALLNLGGAAGPETRKTFVMATKFVPNPGLSQTGIEGSILSEIKARLAK